MVVNILCDVFASDPAWSIGLLRWKAELGIERMCEDAWRWQSKNPNGYGEG
ncbi:UDP-glucose 4-epimerase [Thiomicrospira aerophila AL3]|uniref:UDP-glucose 4-epimerase n=1 Tax=Thiomicrospira aerophila AL3 TaxID=717772 RepID=W0DRQ6_9GAMM|nr:hypothetical protein [Thiomicrospira aerophila]AHF01132.1 UDP-glucose 4-epimerase [Thiomicrospira aerophila AL3]